MQSPREAAKDEEVATDNEADDTDTDVERVLTTYSTDSGETDAEVDEDFGAVRADEGGAPNLKYGPWPSGLVLDPYDWTQIFGNELGIHEMICRLLACTSQARRN